MEEGQRFFVCFPRRAIDRRKPPQIQIICSETYGGLCLDSRNLGLLDHRIDCANYVARHLVLQLEHVIERAIEAIRPYVRTTKSINELARYAHAVASFPYTSF